VFISHPYAAEDALLKWVLLKLINGMRGKYLKVFHDGNKGHGDWAQGYEEVAANVTLRIAKMLRKEKFASYQHLLGYIFKCIAWSYKEAKANKKATAIFEPFEVEVTPEDDSDSDYTMEAMGITKSRALITQLKSRG
jgi:hypothetical protein